MKMYDPEIWFNETNGYEELLENIKASFAAKMKDNIKRHYLELMPQDYLIRFFSISRIHINRNIHVELVSTLLIGSVV